MSDSVQPYGLLHARLLCPWDSLVKSSTRVSFHALPQGINSGLLHSRQIIYHWATSEGLIHKQCYWIKNPWITGWARLLDSFGGCCSSCLVAKLCLTFCDCIDYSLPGSSVHVFPRQEYWSELPFPSPKDLPHPGIEPPSPELAVEFFTTEPRAEPSWAWGDTNCSPAHPK